MTSTSSTPRATGRREDRDGTAYLVFERTFRAPVEDVWAAVTAPERLERWIGTWTGDPASGSVAFRMTAEGEGAPEEEMVIRECDPPRRLAVTSRVGGLVRRHGPEHPGERCDGRWFRPLPGGCAHLRYASHGRARV